MNRLFPWLIAFCLISNCIPTNLLPSKTLASARASSLSILTDIARLAPRQNIDFERNFQELNVEGSILIYDLNNNQTHQYNAARNATAFTPASTFKILSSLIALETSAIPNEISVLTWDGVERSIPAWNRDLNMREAFKISAVWFYQVLVRRVGYEQMQQWLTQIGYGNQAIGSEADVDKFWLGGELQITPQEQIQFLQRFYSNDLPFSQRTIAIVKDIMIVEQTPDYTIRAKTGLASRVGWYVGYLERNENVYFFATNIEIRNEADWRNRIELTRRCLEDLSLL